MYGLCGEVGDQVKRSFGAVIRISLYLILAGGKIYTILGEAKDEAGMHCLHLQWSWTSGLSESCNQPLIMSYGTKL